MEIQFVQLPGYDIWFGAAPTSKNNKVIIIKTGVITRDDAWIQVQPGRIILGGAVESELLRMFADGYGRGRINKLTADICPNGVFAAGSTYDRLKYHLGLIDILWR